MVEPFVLLWLVVGRTMVQLLVAMAALEVAVALVAIVLPRAVLLAVLLVVLLVALLVVQLVVQLEEVVVVAPEFVLVLVRDDSQDRGCNQER